VIFNIKDDIKKMILRIYLIKLSSWLDLANYATLIKRDY